MYDGSDTHYFIKNSMAETFEKTYTEGEIEQKPVELEWGSSS